MEKQKEKRGKKKEQVKKREKERKRKRERTPLSSFFSYLFSLFPQALGEAIRRGNRGIAACRFFFSFPPPLCSSFLIISFSPLPSPLSSFRRFDDQLAILDNSVEHTSHLLFHPFDDVLITCNIFDQIQAWSWREGVRTACFSNNNSPNSHLTGFLFLSCYCLLFWS